MLAGLLACAALTGCLNHGRLGNVRSASQLSWQSETTEPDLCVLPADQRGTLIVRWPSLPIPLAVHAGDFDAAELSAIRAAAEAWNGVRLVHRQVPYFRYADTSGAFTTSSGAPYGASQLCAQTAIGNPLDPDPFTAPVVVHRQGTWPYATNQIAVTSYCLSASSATPQFHMAQLEVNYQGYFNASKRPDLQSVVTRALGTLLGLGDSCSPSSSPPAGVPSCGASGIDPEYLSAVMFPSLSFAADGTGELRRDLQLNDRGRSRCLYTEIP
jgi:hypothetical protein